MEIDEGKQTDIFNYLTTLFQLGQILWEYVRDWLIGTRRQLSLAVYYTRIQ